MNWLLFTLAAPLVSFGRAGPVETRGSASMPSRSALLGLLGAALGLRRDDTDALAMVAKSARFGCRVEQPGRLLSDYHTVQTPSQSLLKKAPHCTRRDELAFPPYELNTVLSTREYYEDYRATIGVCSGDMQALEQFAEALTRPRFVLYVGRKTCVLSWPLAPHVVNVTQWEAALEHFDGLRAEEAERWRKRVPTASAMWPLVHSSAAQHAIERELIDAVADRSQWRETINRDEPRDRQRWLFAPHVWLERADVEVRA